MGVGSFFSKEFLRRENESETNTLALSRLTRSVIPYAHASLPLVTLAPSSISGDIHLSEPATSDDVVNPSVSLRMRERPKSARQGCPAAEMRIFDCATEHEIIGLSICQGTYAAKVTVHNRLGSGMEIVQTIGHAQ